LLNSGYNIYIHKGNDDGFVIVKMKKELTPGTIIAKLPERIDNIFEGLTPNQIQSIKGNVTTDYGIHYSVQPGQYGK